MRGLGERVVRWRGRVLVALLAIGGLTLPLARQAERRLDVSGRLEGSESAAVERELARSFESPLARSVIVVLGGVPGPLTPAGRELLREVVSGLRAVPGVTLTFSHLDGGDTLFAGEEAGTLVVVGLDPALPPDALVPRLREACARLAAGLRGRHPDATLRVTGEPALNLDFRRASADEVRASEARALPLTGLLLLLGFGALLAATLPLAAGALAVTFSLGAAVALAAYWPLSLTLQVVVSMLGLGLGIDYALLIVSRFREALGRGLGPAAAAVEATERAGATVALSGGAVAIGFAGLLLVPVSEIRSLGVGGLLVVATSVLLALTLLPALLAGLGFRVELARLPWRRAGKAARPGAGHAWRRWGRWVMGRPVFVLIVAGTPLVLLAAQAGRLRTELPGGSWLPAGMESTLAIEELSRQGRSGLAQELLVLLDLPEEVFALAAEGWAAQQRLAETLSLDPRLARVQSLPGVARAQGGDLAYASLLPGAVKRCFVSGEGAAVLLRLIPREGATPAQLGRLVRELRAADAAALSGVVGARLRVGGLPAFNVDYEDAVAGRLGLVVALVVAATLLVLFLAFRSLLVPLKAVALNLLSVAAAFGAVVLVFQDGHGIAWLGLESAPGSVFPAVPVLVFAIVFGLSMDYELFLVARVAEARRAGRDEAEAVVEGLAHTGRVITGAAAVMLAVFGAFAAGEFLLVKMLGFALSVAILVDATLIRLALGPALLRLAGRWNWWPGDTLPEAGPEPERAGTRIARATAR